MMDFGMPCTIFAFLRIWPNFTVSGITAWMEKTPDSVLEKRIKVIKRSCNFRMRGDTLRGGRQRKG